jgi:hypothetical protein
MMGTDAAFARAQRQYDAAEPPPDTRECSVCERQKDRGCEVDGRWVCESCLIDDHRCTGCGQMLADGDDGEGGTCRYCSPDADDEE